MKKPKPFDIKNRDVVSGIKLRQTKGKTTKLLSSNKNIQRKASKAKSFFTLTALIILIAGSIFLAVNFVLAIRANTEDNVIKNYGIVHGFNEIPIYPYSENVFNDSLDNITVKQFINDGFSVYRILPGGSFVEASKFYSEELPKLGWEMVFDVELSSEDKKPGQYWVKNGTGVRIYTKTNDIWYQKVTEEDAREGFASLVKLEREREELILNSQKVSLLPDYPWKLTIPGDYFITYSTSTIKDLKTAEIKKLGNTQAVKIIPLSLYEGGSFDKYLKQFTSAYSFKIKTQAIVAMYDGTALEAIITSGTSEYKVIIIINNFNDYVYAIYFEDPSTPILELVKNSMYAPEKKKTL